MFLEHLKINCQLFLMNQVLSVPRTAHPPLKIINGILGLLVICLNLLFLDFIFATQVGY